jgi:hypothetical protein
MSASGLAPLIQGVVELPGGTSGSSASSGASRSTMAPWITSTPLNEMIA